jgi:hypothetical protein
MTEEQVFLAILDLANPADRTAYLEKACGGDGELRRQVEELLAAHFKAGPFLDEPAVEQMAVESASPFHDSTADVRVPRDGDSAASGQKPGDEPGDLHFLQPPGRPDSLGRIGHYEVIQVLGKGGFGIVLRAFDEVLHRVVALKVLAPAIAVTSPARRRFLREARASAQVRHEHVVHVYAVEEQPLPYLVMEFIPGETLQQRSDRIGPLDTPEIVQISRQIAEGLAAAHAHDVVHRDIKPANILLETGNGRLKITDFGLARAADDASLTQSGVVSGTPMYMAPEQARGESIDHRADLFSLGSVIYVMASGRPPFRASTTFGVLKRVAEDQPRPIREVIPEVPEWLCAIVAKLQAKDPAARFQTAREVADLLADCETKLKAKQQVNIALPVPVRGRDLHSAQHGVGPTAPARQNNWTAAAAVVLLVVLALGVTEFAGVTHLIRRPEPTPDPRQPGGEPTPMPAVARETAPPNDWERSVAAMPSAEQVKAVIARLIDLNTGFNGQVVPTIEGDVVTGLEILTEQVSDISPVHVFSKLRLLKCYPGRGKTGKLIDLSPLSGLPLTQLILHDNPVGDLSPLEGMKLIAFDCSSTKVADLSPLHGMPLEELKCGFTPVADLSPLRGMKLREANFQLTRVTDLSPLQGMPLKSLGCHGLRVSDLSPLQGMPLELLDCNGCRLVSDLSPLKGMPLWQLGLGSANVTDLAPLQGMITLKRLAIPNTGRLTDLSPLLGMQLEYVRLTPKNITQGMDILRAMTSLKIIASSGTRPEGLSAPEFWALYDKGEFKD